MNTQYSKKPLTIDYSAIFLTLVQKGFTNRWFGLLSKDPYYPLSVEIKFLSMFQMLLLMWKLKNLPSIPGSSPNSVLVLGWVEMILYCGRGGIKRRRRRRQLEIIEVFTQWVWVFMQPPLYSGSSAGSNWAINCIFMQGPSLASARRNPSLYQPLAVTISRDLHLGS